MSIDFSLSFGVFRTSDRNHEPGNLKIEIQPEGDARSLTRYPCIVDRDEIIRVLRAFETAGLEYVLIGATALGFHGIVRATEDLDLVIRATPDNVERLRAALREAYDGDPHINEISSDDLLGEYPAIRYYPPTGDLYFDVLTRIGESARFETVEAEIKLDRGYVRDGRDAHGTLPSEEGNCPCTRSGGDRDDMPVQKFRSIEEMNKARKPDANEPDFDRFLRHCARYWSIYPKRYPRGVFKFRTIEEAQKARANRAV